ncbi:hypothetical protein AAG570_001028 [Ranatra chinensis]|uniref:Uncharacterized protein n=1 Tax=Ranatra chinensis TaxID=642074 RepID=A0ABD0YCJ1_9HEMI
MVAIVGVRNDVCGAGSGLKASDEAGGRGGVGRAASRRGGARGRGRALGRARAAGGGERPRGAERGRAGGAPHSARRPATGHTDPPSPASARTPVVLHRPPPRCRVVRTHVDTCCCCYLLRLSSPSRAVTPLKSGLAPPECSDTVMSRRKQARPIRLLEDGPGPLPTSLPTADSRRGDVDNVIRAGANRALWSESKARFLLRALPGGSLGTPGVPGTARVANHAGVIGAPYLINGWFLKM